MLRIGDFLDGGLGDSPTIEQLMREIHDHFFHQAKRDGFLSRAAYKLSEIDDRKQVLSLGDAVLDCGCAPGSWLQVAARRVGPKGVVIGIDLKPITFRFQEPNIRTIEGDVREVRASDLLRDIGRERFDVVLSDMAPFTTGDPTRDHFRSAQLCESLVERLPHLLRVGGHVVMKVFEGEMYPQLLAHLKTAFGRVKGYKPKASRSESVEMYVIAHEYRGDSTPVVHKASPNQDASPPRPKPRAGWGT